MAPEIRSFPLSRDSRVRWGFVVCVPARFLRGDRGDSFPGPEPPGIRVKCVVHTSGWAGAPAVGYLLRPERCGHGGLELRMISNRIARDIIRYVFHYPARSQGPGIQIRLQTG